jgi:Family of unknown function (DUF7009)
LKLRIQGNSLRLRLSQREVAQIHDHGRVESSIVFAPDCTLVYLLQVSIWVRSTEAVFHGNSIRVTAPRKLVAEWVESQQVSIVATSSAGLRVLIEKDFQCLHNPNQQDIDAYPHPLMSSPMKLIERTYD